MAAVVLVVDDNENACDVLIEMLGSNGLTAKAVSSGEEALIAIKAASDEGRPFDLVLMDWRMPGMDGQKMSKSYGNTISIRQEPEEVVRSVRTMPTDPARVRRTDPGDPARCPVWQLHAVYSTEDTKQWVEKECKSAGIGCLECKQPVIDAILAEQQPMFERAQKYLDDPSLLRSIIADGCDKARKVAQETMREVRESMGLAYD